MEFQAGRKLRYQLVQPLDSADISGILQFDRTFRERNRGDDIGIGPILYDVDLHTAPGLGPKDFRHIPAEGDKPIGPGISLVEQGLGRPVDDTGDMKSRRHRILREHVVYQDVQFEMAALPQPRHPQDQRSGVRHQQDFVPCLDMISGQPGQPSAHGNERSGLPWRRIFVDIDSFCPDDTHGIIEVERMFRIKGLPRIIHLRTADHMDIIFCRACVRDFSQDERRRRLIRREQFGDDPELFHGFSFNSRS